MKCVTVSLDMWWCEQCAAGKDGSMMGVKVTRGSMLSHCCTLTVACSYTEGMYLRENLIHVCSFTYIFCTSFMYAAVTLRVFTVYSAQVK